MRINISIWAAAHQPLPLLTTDDILESAGLKDCDKGFSVSPGGFLFLRLKGCVTWN